MTTSTNDSDRLYEPYKPGYNDLTDYNGIRWSFVLMIIVIVLGWLLLH